MEIIVAPTMNFVRSGILIGFKPNSNRGSEGALMGRNLSKILGISVATIGVVGTPQMVFINPIMTTHENKIINRPLMNSIIVGRCKSIEVENLGGGY